MKLARRTKFTLNYLKAGYLLSQRTCQKNRFVVFKPEFLVSKRCDKMLCTHHTFPHIHTQRAFPWVRLIFFVLIQTLCSWSSPGMCSRSITLHSPARRQVNYSDLLQKSESIQSTRVTLRHMFNKCLETSSFQLHSAKTTGLTKGELSVRQSVWHN